MRFVHVKSAVAGSVYAASHAALTYRIKYGGEECDLIFDEQGLLGNRVLKYWEAIKNVPPDAPDVKERAYLLAKTSTPIFSK